MKLFITNSEVPPLSGIVIRPQHMGLKVTHLTLASQVWDTLYIDIEECIPEGSLRFLPSKCKEIKVHCPEYPTIHQLHLLVELYPAMNGTLRKAYMKGDGLYDVLREVRWIRD